MPVRASVAQNTQVAVETTPGTAATTGFKRLNTLSIQVAPRLQGRQRVEAFGKKFASLVTPGREDTAITYSGPATFNETTYALSNLLGEPTATQIGVTEGYTRTYTPANSGLYTPKPFTIEQGDDSSADHNHQVTYGLFTSFQLEATREGITISGDGFGRRLTANLANLTAGAVDLGVPVICLPDKVDVYWDSASGGLGTTKLTGLYRIRLGVTGVYGENWTLNSANNSFAGHVDMRPQVAVELTAEANSQAVQYLTAARAGTRGFLRFVVQNTANDIGTSATHTFQFDAALEVLDVGGFGDEGGVLTMPFTFAGVYDPTWSKAMEIKLVNKLATL